MDSLRSLPQGLTRLTIPTGISLLNIILTVTGPVSPLHAGGGRKPTHLSLSEAGELARNVCEYHVYD